MQKDWNMAGMTINATNNPIQNGTEAHSMIWTPDKKIKCALQRALHSALSIFTHLVLNSSLHQLLRTFCMSQIAGA